MSTIRRGLGLLALTGLLATGIATAAPTAVARRTPVVSTPITRDQACEKLADFIRRLQAMPAGPLRDALLRIALNLQTQYCA